MKFFQTLKQDLNKTIINIGFIGAVLMTCLLCFTASAYKDSTNDKSYSIFESFFSFDRSFIVTHYSLNQTPKSLLRSEFYRAEDKNVTSSS